MFWEETMKLASIFTDHMVIQANKPIRIFGEGKGKVRIDFLGKVTEYVSNADSWCVTYPKAQYGGPYEMKVCFDAEEIILKDIYIGEVWLASGQSNMEMVLFRTDGGIDEAKHAKNDKIRLITIPRRVKRDEPLCGWHFEKRTGEDIPWQICDEESALHFSAMGYYVAKELQEKLGIAVGIVSCNWGGVPIETYIERSRFYDVESLKPVIEKYNDSIKNLDWKKYNEEFSKGVLAWEEFYKNFDCDEVEEVREKGIRATAGWAKFPTPALPDGPYLPNSPGCLYESMISRIAPFGFAGVLWYQGESNRAEGYCEKYLTFMKCMRDTFLDEKLPFYAVELASFSNYWEEFYQTTIDRFVTGENWAFNREEQQRATELDYNNYLVTSMGLGQLYDIHPMQKKELAHRMAQKVLKHTYGFDLYADQPIYKSAKFEGEKVIIELDNADGLGVRLPLDAVNMYVADESHILKKAKIEIDGNKLILSSDEVKKPVLARYAFDNFYEGIHLYNKGGLPLAPFRTDKN